MPSHEPDQGFARGLVFIPQTGGPIKDAAARTLLKKKVTQHASKYRRKPGLIRRHATLQCSLVVYDGFSVDALATNTLPESVSRDSSDRDDDIRLDIDEITSFDISTAQGRLSDAATARLVEFRRLSIDRIGICSVNPFAKYPFALNKRDQELMHLGQS